MSTGRIFKDQIMGKERSHVPGGVNCFQKREKRVCDETMMMKQNLGRRGATCMFKSVRAAAFSRTCSSWERALHVHVACV